MIYKLGGAGIVSGGRIMAEKRFEYKNHKVFDNLTGEEHSSNMVSVNVLNQLARVNREGVKKVQKLAKENEQLKQQVQQQELEYATEHHHLAEENEKLKKIIADDFKLCTDEEFNEVEQINKIYKKEGFKGVIDYSKDKLQYYGLVKEIEKGLWVMVTGGWSDNEFFIDCLNNLLSNFGRLHYRAYERGGAFYYTEKPRADVEITLKKDLK